LVQDTLGRKLRVLRAERGLTLREAAKLADVRPGTLSELERGIRRPHDLTLSRIAQAYDVSVEELIDAEEPALAGKAEAPQETGQINRKEKPPPTTVQLEPLELRVALGNVSTWSTYIDALALHAEEWKYEKLGSVVDPADLSEDDFLRFIEGVIPWGQVYQETFKTVREELAPRLVAEVAESRTPQTQAEVERFKQAVRRLSRAMLSIATDRVEQRVAQLASEEKVENNVVQLFAETRKDAAA
jgi:transcriptional regulator with XRE-family HTH domain